MLEINQTILDKLTKKKLDQEYLKLINETSNPYNKSIALRKIGDLALRIKEYDYTLYIYEEAIQCKKNVPNDLYYVLGNVYLYGTFNKDVNKNVFTKPNAKKAINVYKKINDKEESKRLRAYIYYYGLGHSRKKYRKAFKLFKSLNTPSIELATLYFNGKGTKKDKYLALVIYSKLKINKDYEIMNNIIDALKTTKLFTIKENKEIDIDIANMYLKALVYKKDHDSIYNFNEYLLTLEIDKEIKKLLTKFYKEYLKIVINVGNKDISKYVKAYEFITPINKRDAFEYKLMKAELKDESFYFEVGLAYAQGYLLDNNKEKAKFYLSKHLNYLENNLDNKENLKNYIYLCDLLNIDKDKNINFLHIKAKDNDMEYILKLGLAYLYGNIVTKDLIKAKNYLNKYLKSLEPFINENNKSQVASYIGIYESIHEPNERKDFIYYLAKAILNDPYYKLLVGIAYEEGIIIEKDLEKAKKYIKESYEGGFTGSYNKYQEYFNKKQNSSTSIFIDDKKVVESLKILELDKSKDLTIDSIKSQFRKLSKIYHPDLANSKYKDGKKFIEINEAYNYLNKNFEEIKKIKR